MEWHTNFIGQRQQHCYWLYKILDDVISANPQIRSITEIGTGGGALTIVLGCWGARLSIPVLTNDINPKGQAPVKEVLARLGVKSLALDETGPEFINTINKHINSKPTLMICDGGFKAKEVNYWASRIPKGSVISAHDWGIEIGDKDVAGLTMLKPLIQDKWLEENVRMAWWAV